MLVPGIGIVLKLISIVVSSWLLIHLLAGFGVFVAFAYPLWWFLTPSKTTCLSCRAFFDSKWCRFCNHKIETGHLYPKNLRSVFLNFLLLLFLSVFSFGLVFLESKLLQLAGFPPTPKSVTFVIPKKAQYKMGTQFPMKLELNGIKTPINAVQVDLSFDPGILEISEISTTGSFANVFIQKEINNQVGFARLTGGLPNPGYDASDGVFGTIYFIGKKPGLAQVKFLPSSLVLANDGNGTNVLKELSSAAYLILPEDAGDYQSSGEPEVILTPDVLGSSESGETQLLLYEEQGPSILGESTPSPTKDKDKKTENPVVSAIKFIFHSLEKMDSAIIDFWKTIFDRLIP